MSDIIILLIVLGIFIAVTHDVVLRGSLGKLLRNYPAGRLSYRGDLHWLPFIIRQKCSPKTVYVSMANVGFYDEGMLIRFMFPFSLAFHGIDILANEISVIGTTKKFGVRFRKIAIENVEDAYLLLPEFLLKNVKVTWLRDDE